MYFYVKFSRKKGKLIIILKRIGNRRLTVIENRKLLYSYQINTYLDVQKNLYAIFVPRFLPPVH